jgi:uncharacterized protein YfcZ (UPF0381/DUF406 family)
MKPFLALLVIFLMGIFAVLAQDSAYTCEDLAERLSSIQANAAALDANSATISQEITELQNELSNLDAACRGLAFSSEVDGSQPALGPITLEEGVYRASLTTDGYAIVQGTVLDGDCDSEVSYMFNEMEGQASGGAQTVLEIEESCEVILELSNITEDWTLTIEKLN